MSSELNIYTTTFKFFTYVFFCSWKKCTMFIKLTPDTLNPPLNPSITCFFTPSRFSSFLSINWIHFWHSKSDISSLFYPFCSNIINFSFFFFAINRSRCRSCSSLTKLSNGDESIRMWNMPQGFPKRSKFTTP